MHSNRYTLIFTTMITMILAFILSSVFSSLDALTQKNIQADIKKNIFSSLGFSPSIEAPSASNPMIDPEQKTTYTMDVEEPVYEFDLDELMMDKEEKEDAAEETEADLGADEELPAEDDA